MPSFVDGISRKGTTNPFSALLAFRAYTGCGRVKLDRDIWNDAKLEVLIMAATVSL
jgi:hypothetical protein